VCLGTVSFFGLGEMLVFLAVLIAALAYTWRKKAIGWG
jgi:NADH:ubiquinone oxidoreductase subunit 3 (subunit A)